MKRIGTRKFEVTSCDCTKIGAEVERVMEAIKEHDHGCYYTGDELEFQTKLALKVIEGMSDWQWEHNKGVKVKGLANMTMELYDLHESQRKLDEMMVSLNV